MGLDALSVQEFISCAPSLGCNGGNTCQALNWLQTAIFNEVLVQCDLNIVVHIV